MARAQVSLEFLMFLSIAAVYLVASLALFREGLAKVEEASISKTLKEASESIGFEYARLSLSRGSRELAFSSLPTARFNAFSDGETLALQGCGKFAGARKIEIPIRTGGFGELAGSCQDFPFSGKFSAKMRSVNSGDKDQNKDEEGAVSVEISGID